MCQQQYPWEDDCWVASDPMGQVQPCQDHEAQRRQVKIWFPTCLHPVTPTDHAYLPAPIIQTQKETCPTKRIFSKAEANPKQTAATGEIANGAIPGEQGSSDSCQSGPNTFIHDKLEQPNYLFQKDLQASISKNPKGMANMTPS